MIKPEPVNLSVFTMGICMHLGHSFSWQFFLNLHVLLVQSLKFSQRCELMVFLGLFLIICTAPGMHTALCLNMALYIPRNILELFRALVDILVPSFPFNPFGYCIVCSSCYPLPVKLFLTNTHPRKVFLYWLSSEIQ